MIVEKAGCDGCARLRGGGGLLRGARAAKRREFGTNGGAELGVASMISGVGKLGSWGKRERGGVGSIL